MDSTQRALLQAIAQAPDNDQLRLVYADWLDEHCDEGQPGWPANEAGWSLHAEFIRLQFTDAEAAGLRAHRNSRLAEMQSWFGGNVKSLVFDRGFVDGIWLLKGGLEFLQTKGLHHNEPFVRSLYLGEGLKHIGTEGAIAVAKSSHLENLQALSIGSNDIRDAGAIAIANSPHLANLHTLNLGSNDIGDAGVIAIANSPHLANLRSLSFVGNYIGNEGIQAILGSRYLSATAKKSALNPGIILPSSAAAEVAAEALEALVGQWSAAYSGRP
ncbi:MAG: TIGR02996 domain-containing protein [Fimbriiglobus sp.]